MYNIQYEIAYTIIKQIIRPMWVHSGNRERELHVLFWWIFKWVNDSVTLKKHSVHLSPPTAIRMYICLYVNLSVHPSIHPSIILSIILSIYSILLLYLCNIDYKCVPCRWESKDLCLWTETISAYAGLSIFVRKYLVRRRTETLTFAVFT